MHERPNVSIALVVLGIAAIAVFGVTMLGGQTSTILSAVGAAIPAGGGAAPVGAPADEPGSTSAPDASAAAGGGQGAAAQPPGLLIVRTGTLTLETAKVADVVSAASGVVVEHGGFVAGSKERGATDAAAATVDYRIPAAHWEETLTSLRGLATVRDQEIKTDEVTGAVIDLGARIANLRATESALQGIMAKAGKIQDVLDVQTQLTETRGQIEELSAEKASLEDRAAFGSLTVTFELPPAPKPTATVAPSPAWDPGKDVEQATGKLVRIGQKAATAGIWLSIVGLPILMAIVVAFLVVWAAVRFVSRRRAAAPARF